ncbi:DUF4382 domain-containing protein [Roseivirga sp. BDSF3-8]|uniref:DUF4382 domain-containing protein n=1 Tax=Roseivirga sp. BDSF3-8 TaxID=3241598 RepID=UPI0035319F28
MNKLFQGLALASAVFFASCSDDEGSTGTLSLSITDAPIDADLVEEAVISFTQVEVNGPEGWETVAQFEEPLSINLLDYQEGDGYFITEEELPAGNYSEFRLKLSAPERDGGDAANPGSYLKMTDGTVEPLFVPSGSQSGFKIKGEFFLQPDGVTNVTLDFNLRKSVVIAGASEKYLLKPVVRLIVNEDAGMIDGTLVDADSIGGSLVVYSYDDDTFTEAELTADLEENAFPNSVNSDLLDEAGDFRLAFMSSGIYDLYFVRTLDGVEEVIGTRQDVDVIPGTIVDLTVYADSLAN